jgi:hypothetical protein
MTISKFGRERTVCSIIAAAYVFMFNGFAFGAHVIEEWILEGSTHANQIDSFSSTVLV